MSNTSVSSSPANASSPDLSRTLTRHELAADFVVVGGGMSGVCAALAAARNGARVVLIQDRSVLGGNASGEIRMHIVGADTTGNKPGARETGIIEELRLEDAVRNPHRSYAQWDLLLYEKVKAEPNLTLLLDTTCIAVETAASAAGARRLVAVQALRNSTEDLFHIRAPWFADCSGDGRLGAEAGADFTVGREARAAHDESLAEETSDAFHLGASIMFMARKHDTPQPFLSPAWTRKFKKEDFRTKRPFSDYSYGYWWIEWGGHLDAIKDNEAIRHELLRISLGIWDYIKNSGDHPESANYALDWVAPIPGKRESRRFLGRHILTQHDIYNANARPDAVAYGGWPIDLHPIKGMDATDLPPCAWHMFPGLYGIPYGSYCSRNIDNLFFAGRNISATHVAFASTRVMATCAVGGQAVGTAAALLLARGHQTSAELETPEGLHALRQRLALDDAFIPAVANEDGADLARTAAITASSASTPAALVIDGHTRTQRTVWGPWADGQKPHAWHSAALPATLRLELPAAAPLREIHLTFDSGLERTLMLTGSDHSNRNILRGPQPELVRHYRLRLDGEIVAEETFNFLRKRVHRLPAPRPASVVELEILATHGVPEARVFEVRLYR
jgi:hypothetical protein